MNILDNIRSSIALRLVIPVGLVVVVTVSLHIILLSSQREVFERKLLDSERVGGIVEAIMLRDMEKNKLHDFQTYVNMLPLGQDLASVRIYDNQGYLRYAVGDSGIGLKTDKSTHPTCTGCHSEQSTHPSQNKNVRIDNGGQYLFQADFPLENTSECKSCHASSQAYLGNLLTELAFSPIELRLLNRRKMMIYIGTAVMVLAILIIWALIQSQVVKPIKSLVQVIERSKQGELYERAPLVRSDEIGYLTNSYNDMMDSLTDLRNTLEDQVKARTRELESSRIQLLLRENLASLGRMAAGVAHELGNPLTGISSIVQLVKRRKKDDPFVVEQLDLVQEEIARLTRLSRQMLDLAHPENTSVTTFDIKASINKAYQIARLDRRLKRCSVRIPLVESPLLVNANEDAVIQIMMNLLFNAADSTKKDGNISVEATSGNSGSAEVRLRDNGTGIPKDQVSHIFDPFYTGRKPGKGIGLGLSVSHSLARSFQGNLTVESTGSGGTTFLLEVPLKLS